MVTTLGLFALFAIGSALCTTSSPSTEFCIKANYIGTCSGAKTTNVAECDTAKKCAATDKVGDVCGDSNFKGRCEPTNEKCKSVMVACASDAVATTPCMTKAGYIGQCDGADGNQTCVFASECEAGDSIGDDCGTTLKGKCLAADGKCQYTESIQVSYTVKVDAAAAKQSAAAGKLFDFKSALDAAITDYTVTKTTLYCPGALPTVANGVLTCSNVAGSTCSLACDTGYATKENSTNKCGNDGKWAGNDGKCARACKTTASEGARQSDGKFNLVAATYSGITNAATIACDDEFVGSPCKLHCTTNFSVSVDTAYSCTDADALNDDPVWTAGSPGACVAASPKKASATLALNIDDDHELIAAGKDKAFNKLFKTKVATELGVFPQDIAITEYTLIPTTTSGRRRLQIDYSVWVGKGEPEVDAAEDDGRGLRGIR